MQNPTRYYIVNDDDQPVVRGVPVAVRRAAEVDDRREVATTPAAGPRTRRPARVARLVRAAIGRRHAGR